MFVLLFFLMIRRPPRSTRTDTLFPYTTLFRSGWGGASSCLPIGSIESSRPASRAWVCGATRGWTSRERPCGARRPKNRISFQYLNSGYTTPLRSPASPVLRPLVSVSSARIGLFHCTTSVSRSDARRVGKEDVVPCRTGGWHYH